MSKDNRILVVEDDELFARLVSILLVKEGYEVMVVPDGQTALEMVTHFQPHLICLDMYLPELNGWDFLKEYIQSTDAPAAIIVVSARNIDKTELVGAAEFFQKPINMHALLNAINRQMKKHIV